MSNMCVRCRMREICERKKLFLTVAGRRLENFKFSCALHAEVFGCINGVSCGLVTSS